MADKIKPKRLSKGWRAHQRRVKQAAGKTGVASIESASDLVG